jgi:hypothetical protein
MSQIDLKRCHVYMRDGYSKAGAVNNVSNYALGATTMVIDGVTGILPTGVFMHVTGHTTRYTVTAHSETLGNTTSVTFTPALTAAAADNVVLSFGPQSIVLKNGDGTVSFSEKKPREYKLDRGQLSEVRNGDEQPVEVSLDINYEFLESESGATTPTPREVLNQIGAAANWVSSDSDLCRPYSIDLVVEYDPNCSGTDKEVLTFPDFRWESFDGDIKAGTLKLAGKCNTTLVETERTSVF